MSCIDLSGYWELFLDEDKEYTKPPKGNDTIHLPNSVAHAGKGKENKVPDTSYMTENYHFEGYAWYTKMIEIQAGQEEKNITLFLERTRISTVFIDGVEQDTQNSLCGFHRHDLTGKLSVGIHTLTVRVDNTNYPTKGGHMTSPDTQTNWNGILGRIELQIRDKVYPENLQVYAKTPQEVKVTALVHGLQSGNVQVKICRKGGECLAQDICQFEDGKLQVVFALEGENLIWDEYHTNLLEATVILGEESVSTTFGIRNLSHEGRKLLVNGKAVFWRGKHDGLVFPNTGYAPMTVEEWKAVLSTAKEYGINHYRFHTCCPPEAAFGAADELGVYMEPELPFWGTVGAPGEEQYNETEQTYLIEEGFRILNDFGNHPSFVMLSMGNELWGNTERINSFLVAYKEADNRHFYTQGSNNFQFCPVVLDAEDVFCGVRLSGDRLFRGSYAMCDAPQGHIQTTEPNTVHNYDAIIVPATFTNAEDSVEEIEIQYGTGTKKVKAIDGGDMLIPQVPVISHEIGQYDFFPDFGELERYNGVGQPLYLEVYRERLQAVGLYERWKEFFEATGKFAIDCYKRELEATFRAKELSGFQLLDLQDFPGQCVALVGVLNAWMESKGLISANEWRTFCNDVVLLAEIERFVAEAEKEVNIPVKISVCNSELIKGKCLSYLVTTEGNVLAEGKLNIQECEERVRLAGEVQFAVPKLNKPQRIQLRLYVDDTEYENTYTLFAYPKEDINITEEAIIYGEERVKIVKTIEEAKQLKAQGECVLCIPEPGPNTVEGTYCTDFWNYPMFRSISESMNRKVPVGTLGLYIHENRTLQDEFLAQNYSTPQWYHLVMNSHCEVLDGKADVELLVQPIDNVERCHKLGILYYEEGILVCTVRIHELATLPEGKAFAKVLLELCKLNSMECVERMIKL